MMVKRKHKKKPSICEGFLFFRVSIDCSGARSDNNLLHVRVNLGKI